MKKYLLSLLCLLGAGLSAGAAEKVYELTTNLAEITDPANRFIIVSAKAFSNKFYALKGGTTNTVGTKEVATGSTLPSSLTIDDAEIGVFQVLANGTDYKVLYETTKQRYYGGSGSTSMSVSETLPVSTANNAKNFQLTFSVAGNNVTIKSQAATTRAFAFQKTAFKNYATSNLSGADYAYPVFYKEKASGPVAPTYTGVPVAGDYDMIIGEVKALPTIAPAELTYDFSTEDTDIIEIDQIAKTIKAIKMGTATVKFTTGAIENKYLAGEGSFAVTVSGKPAQISFQHASVEAKIGTGVVYQRAVVTEPAGAVVTYSAKDPNSGEVSDVVRVNAETGVINSDDLLKAGSAVIYATTEATDEYAAGEASYSMIVTDPNSEEPPTTTTTIDFTTEDPYGLTTRSSGDTNNYVKDATTKTEGSVTFTLAGRFMSKYESGTSGSALLNLPKNASASNPAGEITISVPSNDAKITRIIFVGGTNLNLLESDTEGGTYTKTNYRWDVTAGQTVNSVHFKNGGSNGANVKKIEVLWQDLTSTLKPAGLTFAQKVYNVEAGETFEANVATTPNEVGTIAYSIDDCPEGTVTEENGKLKIAIPTVGSFTLRATSEENSEFRTGLAIMRINVFQILTPEVESGTTVTEGAIKSDADETTVKFEVNPLLRLHYLDSETEVADPQIADFSDYDTAEGITLSGKGYLYYAQSNFGYTSPVKSFAYNIGSTGVEEIVGAGEGPVRYFDLNGREVKGEKLERGVYVRMQGGHASKVLVK